MQRTINELASVHRQFAFLCLPVIFTEGHVAQAEIEVGHRPVRPCKRASITSVRPICNDGQSVMAQRSRLAIFRFVDGYPPCAGFPLASCRRRYAARFRLMSRARCRHRVSQRNAIVINTAFNQYIGGRNIIERKRSGTKLNLRLRTQHFTGFW